MQSSSHEKAPRIELLPMEDALCTLLGDACRWIEKTRPQPDATESGGTIIGYYDGWTCEARIAGGWVRDKLLGLQSHDLDVALSSLTGHTFALLLKAYLMSDDFARSEVAQRPGSPFSADSSSSKQLVGHITKIAANPEQSKNLETATASVAGLQLDFVNLRKEVYVGDSRIPSMTFGTALEDAERRDITINALFYNVQSRQVEDLTGKGLNDMKQRIIRTPLEPQQTFLDDPLRVLRCIRFASRLGYDVHNDISRCLTSSAEGLEIREALQSKVSRERFGIEVDKMMVGPDPAHAIGLIEKVGLFDVVYGPLPGENLRGKSRDTHKATDAAVQLLSAIWREASRRSDSKTQSNGQNGSSDATSRLVAQLDSGLIEPLLDVEARRLLFYAATLLPLQWQEWEEKKGKWFWAGECVIAKGLKLGVKNAREPLSAMHRSADVLHRPLDQVFQHDDEDYRGRYVPNLVDAAITQRSARALVARLPEVNRPDCGLSTTLSILWTLVSDYATSRDESFSVEPYVSFYRKLLADDVFDRLLEKPILDGKEACALLNTRPGKQMAVILKRVEAWQFDRAAPRDAQERAQLREACSAWLKEEWDKGGLVTPENREGVAPQHPKKKNKASP